MGPLSAPQLLSSLRRSSRTTRPGFNPFYSAASSSTSSVGSRIARRSAPAPRRGATNGTARPRGAVRHRRGRAPSPGARHRGDSGRRCRHRGTLARSGKGPKASTCFCVTFLSPFAGRPFSGDECPPGMPNGHRFSSLPAVRNRAARP